MTKAENQPLTTGRLRAQLGRLGGTPFKLGELKSLLEGAVIVPVSELNRLRREVVAAEVAEGPEALRADGPVPGARVEAQRDQVDGDLVPVGVAAMAEARSCDKVIDPLLQL